MTNLKKSFFLLVFVLAANAFCYAQGLYWVNKISGGPLGENSKENKSYYMPKMFKSLDVEKNEATIVRLDKKLLITVYYDDKMYSEVTFDELDTALTKLSGKMDGKMLELQKKLESMPEEQSKMMEKMLGDKMPGMKKDPKIEVIKTEETKNISGYNCVKYIVKQDDKDLITIWTTHEVHSMGLLKEDMTEFSQKMAQAMPYNGSAMAKAFKDISGFPIQTEIMGITNVVTKIEKSKTQISEFEVPDGYKREKSRLLEMK